VTGDSPTASPAGPWQWIAAGLLTLATLTLATRVLSVAVQVLNGFALPLLISTATVAGLTWQIGSRLRGGRFLVSLASMAFLAPFVLVMVTLPRNAAPKASPADHQVDYWQLSTGREIGFIEVWPDHPNDMPPVILLHGGPGGGATDLDVRWGEEFAAAGYRTYLYDQAGVGWSPRTDESAYTVSASVADLEAIRQQLRTDQLILAGHSWGGSLAAHYAVVHEDRVAALILSAPGPFGGPAVERAGPNLTASTETTSLQFRRPLPLGVRLAESLRPFAGPALMELITQDVEAAIVQDWLDPSAALARGVCAGGDPGETPPLMQNSNYNITANRSISRDLRSFHPSAQLSELTVPTLIIRGVCDYVPWTIHRLYRDSIPGAQMAIIEGVGHGSRTAEPMIEFLSAGSSGRPDYRGAEFPVDDGS